MGRTIRAVFVVLSALLALGCGARDESGGILPLRIHVVEASGAEYDVGQITQRVLTVEPLTTHIGGAVAVDASLEFLREVRRQEKQQLVSTLTFRDGSSVAGRLNGNLEGVGENGPVAVPWRSIVVATFEHEREPEAFEAPQGPWIRVSGEGIEPLDLYSFEIVTMWIVRHGTHAYRQERLPSETLPFTVPRERVIREEWDIPIGNLKRMDLFPYLKQVHVDVGDETIVLEGVFGGQLRQMEGDALLVGRDRRGRWSLSLDRMHREVKQAGVGRSDREPAVRISVEVFGRPLDHEGRLAAVPPVGEITDWDGRTLPVSATWLEPLELKLEDDSVASINPETVAAVEVFGNPWELYDHQRATMEQWLQAQVTLREGSVLPGRLKDRFGYLECVGPRSMPVYVPSYSVRRLTLTGGPARSAATTGN